MHLAISIRRQCELLGLSRSSLYYCQRRNSSYNEQLMRLIDEQYTHTPFYGVSRMTEWLRRQGHQINPKRVRRRPGLAVHFAGLDGFTAEVGCGDKYGR